MKLKNKKTGEIGHLLNHGDGERLWIWTNRESKPEYRYNSLAELNEKWEDYEEPKGINEIDVVLDAIGEYCNEHSYYSGDLEKIKILNTVEEKLKAYKRLKGGGFEFMSCSYGHDKTTDDTGGWIRFRVNHLYDDRYSCEVEKDLDICFGDEE